MNDNFFIDSSVVLYLIDKTAVHKTEVAFTLLERQGFVSPQVLFECISVCLRKFTYTKKEAVLFARYVFETSYFQPENRQVVNTALQVFSKYLLQSYDSKIVASALEAGCKILYSEDMQHGLLIENSLTIINPFLKPDTHQQVQ